MQQHNFNLHNNKLLGTIIVILTGLSSLTAILVYTERKKHRKLETEVLELEKQIKSQQLNHLKSKIV